MPENLSYNSSYTGAQIDEAVVKILSSPTVKTEYGSYTGNGSSGSSSPVTISFPFPPNIVFVNIAGVFRDFSGTMVLIKNCIFAYQFYDNSDSAGVYVSWNGNSVSWYSSDNANAQFNSSERQYNYFAIG